MCRGERLLPIPLCKSCISQSEIQGHVPYDRKERIITERHKQKAEKVYEEIVNEANQEAKIIIERAKVEINREKEKVEDNLKREAIELAIELSKKVIEKNIDEEKNRELIGEFITKVGNS